MGRKISIAYYLSASAGDEDDVELYEVEAARRLKLESVLINFESDSNYELELSLFRGIKQILPSSGSYRAYKGNITDECDEVLDSGERLILHYKNNNSTTARQAFILVRGELE